MVKRRRHRGSYSDAIKATVEEEILQSLTGRRKLPDGVVTILFTDVEGSSELVRSLGDEPARAILRLHDEEIRRAFQAHHGIEVERAGDSFMGVFRLPREALDCALDIQRSLADSASDRSIRVRIGMDTGEAIAEDEGYFGQTVFRASRIAGLAAGGQILVSESTKVLAERAGFVFEDRGVHELKGLGDSHRLFSAIDPNA